MRRNRWTKLHDESGRKVVWVCQYVHNIGGRWKVRWVPGCDHGHPCGWYTLRKHIGPLFESVYQYAPQSSDDENGRSLADGHIVGMNLIPAKDVRRVGSDTMRRKTL